MFDKLSEKARESLFLDSGIHIEGNREVLIENCRRIEEYNDVFVRIVSGKLCIQIWGDALRAFDFKTCGLIVRGRISRIEFIERSSRRYEKKDKK